MKDSALLLGIGNRWRRDDGVGRVVAGRLKQKALPHTDIIEAGGEGTELMEIWKDYRSVFLFDAAFSEGWPGTIYWFDASQQPVPAKFFHGSTHDFGPGEAIELARSLGELPPHFVVYTIEGKDFGHGQGLSPEAEAAVTNLVKIVEAEIQEWIPESVPGSF